MEEAFINIANNNPNLIKYLEKNEFESLGEEDGNIIFLKEKTEEHSLPTMFFCPYVKKT